MYGTYMTYMYRTYMIDWNNYDSNWKKKILGFRNMQEKLEKVSRDEFAQLFAE